MSAEGESGADRVEDRRAPLERIVVVAAVLVGLVNAALRSWLCDDAFISFRYAQNLVHHNGLVFNAGERVEGYTNFLWTLGCAIPIRLGIDVETWAVVLGLAAFCGTLALLARWDRSRLLPAAFPLAVCVAAVHPDLTIWATSGLETSLFTLLTFAGFVTCARGRAALSGALWGLATLTRPDAALFLIVGTLWTLTARRRNGWRDAFRAGLSLAGTWAALVVPHLLFRFRYYGDLVPNTYYAKSADLAWWSQGFLYVGLFAARSWALVLGALVGLALALRDARRVEGSSKAALTTPVTLAALLFGVYTLYVAKVGGDFMFARLLVPVTPFLLVLASDGAARIADRPRRVLALGALVLATTLTPCPVPPAVTRHGIVDEWEFYARENPSWGRDSQEAGRVLARYGAGLPFSVVFAGAQARLVFYSGVPVAIEGVTGLTDRTIARSPLARRGRVGHEKHASPIYLLDRRVDIDLEPPGPGLFRLDLAVPRVPIWLDGHPYRLVRWDPRVVATLVARGARVADFPASIDRYIAAIDSLPIEKLRHDYALLRNFYFRWVDDTAREEPFRRKLAERK